MAQRMMSMSASAVAAALPAQKAEIGREVLQAALAACGLLKGEVEAPPVLALKEDMQVPAPALPARSVGVPSPRLAATQPVMKLGATTGPMTSSAKELKVPQSPLLVPRRVGTSVQIGPGGSAVVGMASPPQVHRTVPASAAPAWVPEPPLGAPVTSELKSNSMIVPAEEPGSGLVMSSREAGVAKNTMVAEAQKVQQEFSMAAAGASPGQQAYLNRLAKAAAEAAERGYGVKRMTHTVRRTRVRKTTNTTDLRTMETETSTEEQAHVDSWMEEGPPTISGVGVMCARGTRVYDQYDDGSAVTKDAHVKGGAMFWLGGDATSVQTTSFNHHFTGNCRSDSRARWARSTPAIPRIAAA